MESWVQSWRPRANAFCNFSTPPVYSTAPATKEWCQAIRSAASVTQNHLPKIIFRSAPGPPNSSDEDVSCIAPATRNASFQILFKCPTPAIVFGHATKPSRFAHFWQGAQSLAPATQYDIWTSKSAPNPSVFYTTAWTFSTSQLPKLVRAWYALYILAWKCASRHNCAHFFIISTSKSGPDLVCFVHFGFKMCFAPERRALFRHHNFQISGPTLVCFVHFATTACNFSSLIWPAGSAPAALASLLFDPPEPQIIGKTQCFATFLPFRAPWSSFFWDFPFFDLLSASLLFSDPSHLCFSSVHIVGSLTSKLPSAISNYCEEPLSELSPPNSPLDFVRFCAPCTDVAISLDLLRWPVRGKTRRGAMDNQENIMIWYFIYIYIYIYVRVYISLCHYIIISFIIIYSKILLVYIYINMYNSW